MAKTLNRYINTKPGPEAVGKTTRYLKLGPGEAEDAGYPGSFVADRLETIDHGSIGTLNGGPTATSGQFTCTFDNSGTGANGSDGYTLTTGTSSGNKNVVTHGRRVSASGAVGKEVTASYTLKYGTVTTQSSIIGIHATAADPIGTAPTNGVYFAVSNATLVGRVRGNSGTAADSATLATLVGGTNVKIGYRFYNSGVAATSWGFWYVNGTATAFTAAQITQLIAMTGDLFHQYHVQTATAGARTLVIERSWVVSDL